MFKILNGYENIDINIVLSLKKDNRTRGHKVTLAKDNCRLDIRKYSFSQRTINELNKLSTDCVTASSVNIFKNKIDTCLKRADYTYIKHVGPLAIWVFAFDGNLVQSCSCYMFLILTSLENKDTADDLYLL